MANEAVNASVTAGSSVLASPRGSGVEFRILGPLEVVGDDGPVALGGGRERALLALLLLHANEVVRTDSLIEELWRGEPPASAAKALQVYVSRLRKRLGAEVVVTRARGYAVVVAHDQLDVARFERLVDEARGAGPLEAASKLRDALSLSRGPPLPELANEPFAQADVARLEELRLAALEDRIDADLALGRHSELVAELELLVARNPYRERLRRQLMLALYRSGRQTEALAAYREARRALSDELGLEPSSELKELERRILAHDEALAAPEAPTEAVTHEPARERRRPRLTGRRALLLAGVVAAALATGVAVAAVWLGGSAPDSVVAHPGSIAVIDPGSNRVVDAIPVADRPTQIAIRGDQVWVLHPDSRLLTLVGRSEREVVRSVGLGEAPSSLAPDGHGVWVTDARTGAVTLYEPERLTVVRTVRTRARPLPPLRISDAGQVAIGFGSVWFASGGRTITRIDAASGRVVTRIPNVETGESLGGIAVGAESVWVAGPFQESMVVRIDPRRNAVVARIFVQKFRLNGIAVGEGAVWVSDVGNDQIWAIDAVKNEPIGTTTVGGQPLSLAYGDGSIWVANSGDGTVSRIDARSRQVVATIPVGGSPNGVAATSDGIWVTVD
jgi:YVTN family beta-propeller protein